MEVEPAVSVLRLKAIARLANSARLSHLHIVWLRLEKLLTKQWVEDAHAASILRPRQLFLEIHNLFDVNLRKLRVHG
jgi:hypothetical protein